MVKINFYYMSENNPLEKQLDEIIHSINSLYNKVVEQGQKIDTLESKMHSSSQGTRLSSAPPPPPPPPPHTQGTPSAPPKPKQSFEEQIGGQWFAKIGIVVLVLGISFFLKYAFDNEWVGYTGRIILGIVAGIALLGIGELLRKKYMVYSQVLSGGGIAILYLSIYAAYSWYDLISQPVAFGAMILITLVSGFLSVWSGEPALVIMGSIGGFLTPVLIGSKDSNLYTLFTYLVLLDLGVLGVSFFKKWRALNLIGIIGTQIYLLSWRALGVEAQEIWPLAVYTNIFFIIFTIAIVAHNILKKIKSEFYDLLLLLVNSIATFLIIYDLFDGNKIGLSFYALVLAMIYFVIAYISFANNKEDKALALFLPGLSVTFLTISLGIMFRQHWITIAWAVEACILSFISFQLRQKNFRIFSLIMFALVLARLIFIHSFLRIDASYISFLNKRTLVFVVVIAAIGGVMSLYGKYKDTLTEEEKKLITVMVIVTNFLALLVLSQEVYGFSQKQIYTLTSEFLDNQKYKSNDPYAQRGDDPSYNVRSAEYNKKIRSVRSRQSISLSILWALYSVGLVVSGFLRKSRLLRVSGIILFGVTIVKLFLADLWNLGPLYRIIGSITLGIILLSTAFIYQKYKDRIKEIM